MDTEKKGKFNNYNRELVGRLRGSDQLLTHEPDLDNANVGRNQF